MMRFRDDDDDDSSDLGPQHSSSTGQLLKEHVQAVAAVKDGERCRQSSVPLALALQDREGGPNDDAPSSWTLLLAFPQVQCRSSMY